MAGFDESESDRDLPGSSSCKDPETSNTPVWVGCKVSALNSGMLRERLLLSKKKLG